MALLGNSECDIETNWFVFTGAASSGKSTILSYFSQKGYTIKEEVIRSYLTDLYGTEIPVNELPWASQEFQSKLLSLKIEREKLLPQQNLIIFDRGVPDAYAYASIRGIDMNDIYIPHPYRYRAIFLFENLPVTHDNLRRDNDSEIVTQHKALTHYYQLFNYKLIHVPRFSIDKKESILKRIEYIENEINSLLSL